MAGGIGQQSTAAPRLHAAAAPYKLEDATLLSSFGERPAFSPDGKRIAFVGKAYGDAFEIDIVSGRIRNLTSHIPHQGVARIQYLPDGNYLITAPRHYDGKNSRIALELWVLDKTLARGLQPLNERVFEGVAVSRQKNRIAWTTFDPPVRLKSGESWMKVFTDGSKGRRYQAEITYRGDIPQIVNKREVMPELPRECRFVEFQDFRRDDQELTFSCVALQSSTTEGVQVSVMGFDTEAQAYATYRSVVGEYNEVEGIAPDGSWSTVECGAQKRPSLLDICRLQLRPGSELEPLIVGTALGSTQLISNPVVSPDGKFVAFQTGDETIGESGEGLGIFLQKIKQ